MYTPQDQDARLKPYGEVWRGFEKIYVHRLYRFYEGRWHREFQDALPVMEKWLKDLGFSLVSPDQKHEKCGYYRIERRQSMRQLFRIETPIPCDIEGCSNTNAVLIVQVEEERSAVCPACAKAMSDMNSDNAEFFAQTPLLTRIYDGDPAILSD